MAAIVTSFNTRRSDAASISFILRFFGLSTKSNAEALTPAHLSASEGRPLAAATPARPPFVGSFGMATVESVDSAARSAIFKYSANGSMRMPAALASWESFPRSRLPYTAGAGRNSHRF